MGHVVTYIQTALNRCNRCYVVMHLCLCSPDKLKKDCEFEREQRAGHIRDSREEREGGHGVIFFYSK